MLLTALLSLALLAPRAFAASGTLRVCDDVIEPVTLDPLKEFSEKNHTIIQQIFDGLVRFDSEGRIEPALAVSWSRLDPLTMEFKLRGGVRFHDGEAMDAEAVRFSLDRFADPQGGFPGAGFLGSIEKVEVVGKLTVRVKTRFPDGVLLHRLAGLVTIVPPRYIAAHGEAYFGAHPVGTGAFRFVSWDAGSRIVLGANEDYWSGGPSRFKELIFLFLPIEKQVEGLLAGDVDIVTELPGTATLKVMKNASTRIIKRESFYTIGASVNMSTGPLVDKRVRQALNHAIDREALIRYDLLGNGKALASLTMAGEIGHDPSLRPYPYDPHKARRLLAEAGYPKGVRLRVVVKAQGERTMRIISNQLKKVGIRLDVRQTTDATVIHDIQNGSWDFAFGGCPDPMAHSFFIQSIYLSSLSPYSLMKNETYDRLLGKMVGALGPEEQHRAGMELDRYVHDEALSIFTYQRIKTYGVGKDIHFVPSITGMPYFSLSHSKDRL